LRYDHLRRVLVVVVAGLLFLPAALFSQQHNPSQGRSVRLISVSGKVTVKRPGAAEGVPAQLNTPIEVGFDVATSDDGLATVKLENGSTIQLNELTKANFTQLATDADGNKLNVVTLEQGYADFYFIPERQALYMVKIADTTLTPNGKTKFQTGFIGGKMQARVSAGSIIVSAHSGSLTLDKGRFMEYEPSADEAVATSHARVVRLSYVSGRVMVKRPGLAEEEPAMVNVPIQEGFELSTSQGSYAEVEFENGSTARLGELSKLLFHQLALDADGNKLNGMSFERGYATFHFMPEHNLPPAAKRDGTIHLRRTYSDVYRVKIADATVTADGKCEFRTDLEEDRLRVEVFNGSVDVATSTLSSKLGEGKVLEHKSGGTELAFNTRRGIVKDTWDQWTEARDKQVQLTEKDEPVHPIGPRYGWSELDTFGEWIALPGGRFGWSPYARAGWSPYTHGPWEWYPGLGWTWISGEPWGWLPYHCGLWDFDPSFGWYWMDPMFGCGLWGASLVNWYAGPGWIGWAPMGSPQPPRTGRPVHTGPRPPGGGHPRPVPVLGHFPRGVVTVPTSVVQNRQLITPQTVNHIPLTVANMIEHPPFEPAPRSTGEASSLALSGGTTSRSNTVTAAAPPPPARLSGPRPSFASHHASAPSTILMGGDAVKEGALLAQHHLHSGREPLRAVEGATLGGRYPVRGSIGEFRGNALGAGEKNGGASGKNGPWGGPTVSRHGGGSGAVIMSHGQGGGGSRGGGYSGGGGVGSSSGGGRSGGSGVGSVSSGGGAARSGGGGGSISGGGGAAHSGGGGGSASGGGGGGHH
jgi:ferric-dicitrate binding protein FerR (iron transport regulator)